MSLDEAVLEMVAHDGEMDYSTWPSIIDPLLDRIKHITYHDFPIPRLYSSITHQSQLESPSQLRSEAIGDLSQPPSDSQTPTTPTRNLPPVPLFPQSSTTPTSLVLDSLPPSQNPPSSNPIEELPLPLIQLLNGITSTLHTSFSTRPPHTIQRLAELILRPTSHYRTLPAWLRAVDRVVNVSSSADIFPLSETPPLLANGVNGENAATADGIHWSNLTTADANTRNAYDKESLGSDESLGGALLTPIPWLRNSSHSGMHLDSDESGEGTDTQDSSAASDGLDPLDVHSSTASDHDMGSMSQGSPIVNLPSDPLVPARQDGAVTQGELIRMEQEAGVVPVSTSTGRPPTSMGMGMGMHGGGEGVDGEEMDVETTGDMSVAPHARGPDVVGVQDMGKVGGEEVQITIGSPPSPSAGVGGVDVSPDGPGAVGGEWEVVGKEGEGEAEDVEMSMGSPDKAKSDNVAGTEDATKAKDEEDIVLVDVDGKMEDDTTAAEKGS